MSVGAVCFPEYLKQRRGDNESRSNEAFLMQTLQGTPSVWSRMQTAERVAPVHATGNYSYTCTRMHGPGWVMVGDAYAFIDPVFSSGVYLGMNSAEHAAEVVDGALRDPANEQRLQRAMEKRLKRGLKHFSWFIYRFTTPVMERLFASPRNTFQVEQAVISMLAGDVFDNRPVLRRLRLFRLIYAFNALQLAPRAFAWLAAPEAPGGRGLRRRHPAGRKSMSRPMGSLPATAPHARLDVDYVQADSPDALLQGDDVLAVLGFGNDAPRNDDPRYLRVPLQPYARRHSRSGGPARRSAMVAKATSPGPPTGSCRSARSKSMNARSASKPPPSKPIPGCSPSSAAAPRRGCCGSGTTWTPLPWATVMPSAIASSASAARAAWAISTPLPCRRRPRSAVATTSA